MLKEMPLKVLITGSGRCGTYSMAQFLNGMKYISGENVTSFHETERDFVVENLVDGNLDILEEFFLGLQNSIEVSPYISLFPDRPIEAVPLIALIRDGRKTVQSGMNSGWFVSLGASDYTWYDMLPQFEGDRFQKSCQLWAWIYEKLQAWEATFFKIEDISGNEATREALFRILNIEPNKSIFKIGNFARKRKRRVEELGYAPLGEWKDWMPDQKLYFVEHCGKLMSQYYPEILL